MTAETLTLWVVSPAIVAIWILMWPASKWHEEACERPEGQGWGSGG